MPPTQERNVTIQNPYLEGFYRGITNQSSWEGRVDVITNRLSTRFDPKQDRRTGAPLFSELAETNRLRGEIFGDLVSEGRLQPDKLQDIDESIVELEVYLESFYSLDGLTEQNLEDKTRAAIKRIRTEYKGEDVEYFVDYVRRLMTKVAAEPQVNPALQSVDANKEPKANRLSLLAIIEDVPSGNLRTELSSRFGKYLTQSITKIDPREITADISFVEGVIGELSLERKPNPIKLEAVFTTLGFLDTCQAEQAFLARTDKQRTIDLEIKPPEAPPTPEPDLNNLYPHLHSQEEVSRTLKNLHYEIIKNKDVDTVIRIGNVSLTIAEHIRNLTRLELEKRTQNPTSQWIRGLETQWAQFVGTPEEKENQRQRAIESLLTEIKHAGYVGKRPNPEIIPPNVEYDEVKRYLQTSSDRRAQKETQVNFNQMLNRLGIQDAAQVTGQMFDTAAAVEGYEAFGGRGLEQYFFVAEFRERLDYIRSLYDRNVKEAEYALSRLLFETIRTGGSQIISMVLRSWYEDPDTRTPDFKLKKGARLVSAIEQPKGYTSFKDLYSAVGFIKPEERAAIYEAKTDGSFVMKITKIDGTTEEKTFDFVVGVNDYVANILNTEYIPEILANKAEGPADDAPKGRDLDEFKRRFNEDGIYDAALAGHSNNSMKWLAYSVLFKMGFLKEEAKKMAENFIVNGTLVDNEGNKYDCIWTDRITVTDQAPINSFARWISTNWGIITAGENLLMADRMTYLYAVGEEFGDRDFFGQRKVEDRSGYRNASGAVTFLMHERALNGKQLLVPVDLAQVEAELIGPLIAETSSDDATTNTLREGYIRKLIEARMVPPEHTTEMGALLLGEGKYTVPEGMNLDEKQMYILGDPQILGSGMIDRFMAQHFDKREYPRITPFEFWKHINVGNINSPEFNQAWGNYDFEPLLRREGLIDAHFEKLRQINPNATIGINGWNLFLEYANANLLHRDTEDQGVRSVDSSTRYNVGKEEGVEAIDKLLENAETGFEPVGWETVPLLGEARLKENASQVFDGLRGKLSKMDPLRLDSFIVDSYRANARLVSIALLHSQSRGSWSLNTRVNNIDLRNLYKGDGNGRFVETPITLGQFRQRWYQILGDPTQTNPQVRELIENIQHRFESYGFYFSNSVENIAKKGEKCKFAHGPNFSYVPSTIEAKELLENIVQDESIVDQYRKRAKVLLDAELFSWSYLVKGQIGIGSRTIEAFFRDKTIIESQNPELYEQFTRGIYVDNLAQDCVFFPHPVRGHIKEPRGKGLASRQRVYIQRWPKGPKSNLLHRAGNLATTE